MSVTTDLLDGVAAWIAGAGLAVYTPGVAYLAGVTGISFKNMPDAPDRMVVLSTYSLSDEPVQALGQVGLHIWCRGGAVPTDVDDLADSIFALIHGATHRDFGSVHAVQILRKISAPLGMDGNRRWERADSYYVDLNVPASANRPG